MKTETKTTEIAARTGYLGVYFLLTEQQLSQFLLRNTDCDNDKGSVGGNGLFWVLLFVYQCVTIVMTFPQ